MISSGKSENLLDDPTRGCNSIPNMSAFAYVMSGARNSSVRSHHTIVLRGCKLSCSTDFDCALMRAVKVSITSLSSDHHPRIRLCSRRPGLSLEVLSQFPCRKWELTCLPPWVAKEKMGTLLLASEMPVPIPRNRTVQPNVSLNINTDGRPIPTKKR